ncbi:hypothetical protein N3K66_006134 [Trichothecium roseum]|uniref:Uncharacterized protein n=1 Tax=Trichothecium roseum TaxID=47278 RepID=A0ACC0V1B6_9HYPO|nr:hypothetical protein N3K66_006134 [Trichothecium roseum]
MVTYKDIQNSNAQLSDATAPRVAVFVGGTSGIGKYTIRALAATGASVRIYLVGRKSSSERTRAFIQELNAINPKAEVVWTEGEISLLAETRRVCEVIRSRESSVDLLFLTAGYAPFGTRRETAEGIEVAQSLEYYSRMLFIHHLLPLLKRSPGGRVVSVLGGGLERATSINLDDLDLRKPASFSGVKAQTHYVGLNTTYMDRLARDNPDVIFVHSWPGWVDTGNVRRGQDPNSPWAWFVWLFLDRLIGLVSAGDDVAGQRHLFQATSAYFGGRGVPWTGGPPGVNSANEAKGGLFLVNYKCRTTPNAKVMPVLREKAQEKVWAHTQEVLKDYM